MLGCLKLPAVTAARRAFTAPHVAMVCARMLAFSARFLRGFRAFIPCHNVALLIRESAWRSNIVFVAWCGRARTMIFAATAIGVPWLICAASAVPKSFGHKCS